MRKIDTLSPSLDVLLVASRTPLSGAPVGCKNKEQLDLRRCRRSDEGTPGARVA